MDRGTSSALAGRRLLAARSRVCGSQYRIPGLRGLRLCAVGFPGVRGPRREGPSLFPVLPLGGAEWAWLERGYGVRPLLRRWLGRSFGWCHGFLGSGPGNRTGGGAAGDVLRKG